MSAILKTVKPKRIPLAEQFYNLVLEWGFCDPPQREWVFHPTRDWRMDFAWPELRFAVDVQGGVYMRGPSGHRSGSGVVKDIEKYNAAQAENVYVFLVHTGDLGSKLKREELCERFIDAATAAAARVQTQKLLLLSGLAEAPNASPMGIRLQHYCDRHPEQYCYGDDTLDECLLFPSPVSRRLSLRASSGIHRSP